MAVGDVNSPERGSGARYNDGKPDWSIMPTHLLEEVVRVWEYGARKYARYNWAKGMKWSVPYACMIRHLYAWWWQGERNDKESGYSHLAHVVCNVMMLMHYETKYKEGDDRPEEFKIGNSGGEADTARPDELSKGVAADSTDRTDAQGPITGPEHSGSITINRQHRPRWTGGRY